MSNNVSRHSVMSLTWPIVDDSRASLCDALDELLTAAVERVDLDCSRLTTATSNDIKNLWHTRTKCEDAGVELQLTAVGNDLYSVIEILDLHEVFAIKRSHPHSAPESTEHAPSNERLRPLELEIIPTSTSVAQSVKSVRDYLTSVSPPPVIELEIVTVLYELLVNLRDHAKLAPEDTICITAALANHKIDVTIVDPGMPFDPRLESSELDVVKAMKTNSTRGFGLFLVNKMVDHLSYRRIHGNQNEIMFTKQW